MPARDSHFLIAGLDFGTSFTKVVVQSHGADQGRTRVVSCNGAVLIPSLVGIDGSHVHGPMCRPLPGPVAYLKMLAAQALRDRRTPGLDLAMPEPVRALAAHAPPPAALHALLAWYFGGLIAMVEGFVANCGDWPGFGEMPDDFLAFQLCVPTEFDQDPVIHDAFRGALKTGCMLSRFLGPALADRVRVPDLLEFCARAPQAPLFQQYESRCFTYPEVAAGVQAVMRSPTAQDGLYLTVDVGAGTVDMNLFRRYTAQGVDLAAAGREPPNNLDYYAARVAFLGAARIAERRTINPFADLGVAPGTGQDDWGLAALPEADLMRLLRSDVRDLFSSAQRYQRNLGGRPGGRTYDRCKVYAWGGGYRHPAYGEALESEIRELMTQTGGIGALPRPQHLRLPQGVGFDRFAIAYGLSFPPANLETVRLPNQLTTWEARFGQSAAPENLAQRPPDYWTNPRYGAE